MSCPREIVEVLTAEVHTVAVGSRRLTQAIYRQLDAVRPERVEPFGRVRLRDSRDTGPGIAVVGRDRVTGALVRSRTTPTDWHLGTCDCDRCRRWAEWSALPLLILGSLR